MRQIVGKQNLNFVNEMEKGMKLSRNLFPY